MADRIAPRRAFEPSRLAVLSRFIRREWVWVAALLAAIFVAFLYRLDAVIVADMDEGTYLYGGKLVAAGAVPYRDFLLAHPPTVVYLAAGWIALFGADVMVARFGYAALVLLSTIPLYLIARSLSGSRLAGLFAIATYTTGMLLLANMGRTVRLEPVMNAALISAFALLLRRPRRPPLTLAGGALLGLAILVKLVAVVPAAAFLLAEAIWSRPGLLKRWAVLAIGGAIVLIPATFQLLALDHFLEDVIASQIDRPGLPLGVRLMFVFQDVVRDPLIPLALGVAVWFVARSRDDRVRSIALVAILSTAALVVLFKTFFGYYLVQVLPWLSIVLAVGVAGLGRRVSGQLWNRCLTATTLAIALAVPVIYEEVYFRTAHEHVASAGPVATALRAASGPVYSMYPSFALWSQRDACGSYYDADSLIARINGRLRDAGFVMIFSACSALVLWTGELTEYPAAADYVKRNFTLTLANEDYALWTRNTR